MSKNWIDFHWAPHKWLHCSDLIIYFLPLQCALKPKNIHRWQSPYLYWALENRQHKKNPNPTNHFTQVCASKNNHYADKFFLFHNPTWVHSFSRNLEQPQWFSHSMFKRYNSAALLLYFHLSTVHIQAEKWKHVLKCFLM